jgi:predicted nucleic acid-binding protein
MIVLDASLAVKLFVVEVFTAQAIALFRSWKAAGIELVAPDFMPSEFATALRKKIREGILTDNGAKRLMGELYENGIDFRPSRPLHNRAIDLAVELNQRLAYDSHYFALAESLDCEFWTADRPFYRAARSRYPRVQWIGNYNP